METATREDVEKLKRNWLNDPCYDLTVMNDERYEPYREELAKFQKEYYDKLTAERDALIKAEGDARQRDERFPVFVDLVKAMVTGRDTDGSIAISMALKLTEKIFAAKERL